MSSSSRKSENISLTYIIHDAALRIIKHGLSLLNQTFTKTEFPKCGINQIMFK